MPHRNKQINDKGIQKHNKKDRVRLSVSQEGKEQEVFRKRE